MRATTYVAGAWTLVGRNTSGSWVSTSRKPGTSRETPTTVTARADIGMALESSYDFVDGCNWEVTETLVPRGDGTFDYQYREHVGTCEEDAEPGLACERSGIVDIAQHVDEGDHLRRDRQAARLSHGLRP